MCFFFRHVTQAFSPPPLSKGAGLGSSILTAVGKGLLSYEHLSLKTILSHAWTLPTSCWLVNMKPSYAPIFVDETAYNYKQPKICCSLNVGLCRWTNTQNLCHQLLCPHGEKPLLSEPELPPSIFFQDLL